MNLPIAQPISSSRITSVARILCAASLLIISASAFAQRILPNDTERTYEVDARRRLDLQAKKIWQLKEDKSDDKSFYTSAPFLKLEKDYRAANEKYMQFVAYDDRKKLHLDVALALVDADIEAAKIDPREASMATPTHKAEVVDPTSDPKSAGPD